MKKYISYSLFFALLSSCDSGAKSKSQTFNFMQLIGEWKTETDDNVILESWTQNGDLLSGISFELMGEERTVTEIISLENLTGTPIYSPQVLNQNENKSIPFTCSFQNNYRIDFTNKLHDFPQVIRYEFITPDSMDVTIGLFPLEQNGEKMMFHFHRN